MYSRREINDSEVSHWLTPLIGSPVNVVNPNDLGINNVNEKINSVNPRVRRINSVNKLTTLTDDPTVNAVNKKINSVNFRPAGRVYKPFGFLQIQRNLQKLSSSINFITVPVNYDTLLTKLSSSINSVTVSRSYAPTMTKLRVSLNRKTSEAPYPKESKERTNRTNRRS